MEVIRNYLAVVGYCRKVPQPWWKFPWVCWHVYLWRKETGLIHPKASLMDKLKGISSYGHWLRMMKEVSDGD